MQPAYDDDAKAINKLIRRQFTGLSWKQGASGDWNAFANDFLPDATLYPSARPASGQSVTSFVDRMKTLCGSTLQSFDERVLGTKTFVFGNIAVAVAAAEMTENEVEANRNVEMMLLVKSEGAWRIAAQAWDRVTSSNPIPDELMTSAAEPASCPEMMKTGQASLTMIGQLRVATYRKFAPSMATELP